jgi:4-nitrophenyl phosphatase
MQALMQRVLAQESSALAELAIQLNPDAMSRAVEAILTCEGRVLVTGAGTSSSLARRLAHLLTCSGAPAVYVDAGQSQHGYSAIVTEHDVLIAFSRGGETADIIFLLSIAAERGATRIGVLEDLQSSMAKLCDEVLPARVSRENDAGGIIPLASTLAQAAVGDILCAAVLEVRGYSDVQFGRLHPGGAVGERLQMDSAQDPSQADPSGKAGDPKVDLLGSDTGALAAVRGYILDMDGVLWHGPEPLPGMQEFIHTLNELDLPFVLATNNPSQHPEGFAEKARSFGLEFNDDQVVTSSMATIHYLKKKYPAGSRIHVIGEAALKDMVAEAGYERADEDVVAVVVALERGLTYETIKRGSLLIQSGAEFIGTNADPSYPTEEGILPGSGTMVIALQAASNVTPNVMGKPNPGIFDLACARLELPPQQIASVGDRLDTDIAGGLRYGTRTVLVLTGISTLEEARTGVVHPDWVFDGLPALTEAIRRNQKS